MRRGLFLLLFVVACTSPVVDRTDTGDLGQADVTIVTVDGVELVVAVASTPEARSQGLRGVDDLGDLDGMLFVWDQTPVTLRFTMAGTLMDLDIAFFEADGSFVDSFTMTACNEEPCPTYAASAPYAVALETPVGMLPPLGPGSSLTVGD